MFGFCCAEDEGPAAVVEVVQPVFSSPAERQDKLAPDAGGPKAEPAAEPAPAAGRTAEGDLEMTLTRAAVGRPWGWQVDILQDTALFVCTLRPNSDMPVNVYNASVAKEDRIQECDYVLSVNGVKGNAQAMTDATKQESTLQLRLRRAAKFDVTFPKEGDSAGLNLRFGPSGNSLLIESMGDGAAKKSEPALKPGDRIICINGIAGSPSALRQALQEHDPLELTIARLEGSC